METASWYSGLIKGKNAYQTLILFGASCGVVLAGYNSPEYTYTADTNTKFFHCCFSHLLHTSALYHLEARNPLTKKTDQLKMPLNFLTPPWRKSPPPQWARAFSLLTLHDHTQDTPHAVGLLWKSGQPNAHTSPWQHTSQNTAIRTRNRSNWAAAYPRLRPRGYWTRIPVNLRNYRYFYFLYSLLKYNIKLEIPCYSKYSGIVSWPVHFKRMFWLKMT